MMMMKLPDEWMETANHSKTVMDMTVTCEQIEIKQTCYEKIKTMLVTCFVYKLTAKYIVLTL